MKEKQIIDSLTARNLELHIEMNTLQDSVLGYLTVLNKQKADIIFLQTRLDVAQRRINSGSS